MGQSAFIFGVNSNPLLAAGPDCIGMPASAKVKIKWVFDISGIFFHHYRKG
jgi:hypothetical protein